MLRFLCVHLIAPSRIHVPAAYRLRIYKNVNTKRSEAYFVQATYVPRTCDVIATFPWRISDVSVFVWNFTFVHMHGVSRRMCYGRVTYVWRMQCTRDVSTAYVLRSILICDVSALYQRLCSHAIRTLLLSITRGRRCQRRNLDNLN